MNWTEKQLADYQRRNGVPSRTNTADVSAPPFALPAQDIVLDLPRPVSVNKLRRINWSERKRAAAWRKMADNYLLQAKSQGLRFNRIPRFELAIVLDESKVFIDLDNTLKLLIDYLHAVEIVENDAPKNMRGIAVTWGTTLDAPSGCRVIVRPCA